MNADNFCFWLKGYFEILSAGPKTSEKLVLTAEQVEMIETHLNYVFAEKQQAVRVPFVRQDDWKNPLTGAVTFSTDPTGAKIC
jgi:hypothetical protein